MFLKIRQWQFRRWKKSKMKYQFNALIYCIKKNFIFFLILFLISTSKCFSINSSPGVKEITILEEVIGINVSLKSLFFLFHFILTFYIITMFYNYEKNNSYEFIITRSNKTFLWKKILLISLFIIIFRSFHFYIVYLFLKDIFVIKWIYFFKNIYIYLLYEFLIFFIYLLLLKIIKTLSN